MATSLPEKSEHAKPKFLEQVRTILRTRHYSLRTEEAYLGWIRRFILFQGKRHPQEMGGAEVAGFLNYLAGEREVAAATQNQALNALLFLYEVVLERKLGVVEGLQRVRRPPKLPVVLAKAEVEAVLRELSGQYRLMANLLYGSGLRLLQCLRLRVKDVDFRYLQITLRDAKGGKDRKTMLPVIVAPILRAHLERVQAVHEQELAAGFGTVWLPEPTPARTSGRRDNGPGNGFSRQRSARSTRAESRRMANRCGSDIMWARRICKMPSR